MLIGVALLLYLFVVESYMGGGDFIKKNIKREITSKKQFRKTKENFIHIIYILFYNFRFFYTLSKFLNSKRLSGSHMNLAKNTATETT